MKRSVLCMLTLLLAGCAPDNAYRRTQSTFKIQFPGGKRYYQPAKAGLAFVEFNSKGQLFDSKEVDRALSLIDDFKAADLRDNGPESDGIVLFLFVHGWKNNSSESSGNVWGFRKALDEYAAIAKPRPVVGVYLSWPGVGWPGSSGGILEQFSFWNREAVAGQVGGNGMTQVLERILHRAKGPDYQEKSSCILVGHSFGGLVLETAITPLLQRFIEQMPVGGGGSHPPADLILLLNEAAPASLAQPFLYYLDDHGIEYADPATGRKHPLLLSMTSQGDVATKFAFPGGQFISAAKPQTPAGTSWPDRFGIGGENTYFRLTTANTIALQNHDFVKRADGTASEAYVTIPVGPHLTYDFVPKTSSNHTPYWVSQLPQVFVPDHGTVFGARFICLLRDFLDTSRVVPANPSASSVSACPAEGRGARQVASFAAPTRTRLTLHKQH